MKTFKTLSTFVVYLVIRMQPCMRKVQRNQGL